MFFQRYGIAWRWECPYCDLVYRHPIEYLVTQAVKTHLIIRHERWQPVTLILGLHDVRIRPREVLVTHRDERLF